ncbi:MAG: dienelactone hydrolase family protein [Gemmatimonadales bacterium]
MKVILSIMAGLALVAVATAPEVHRLPADAAGAAERLAASPRHGEWVTIRTPERDSVVAWVSFPERTDKAPVVVVLHDDTGLSPWHRAVADQLAAEGFIAIAPELLTMRRAGDLTVPLAPDSGRAAIRTVQDAEVDRWVDAVAAYGLGLPAAAETFGVIGFCWGGEQSFRYAARTRGLGAAVVYSGAAPAARDLRKVRAPILGLYGSADARIAATVEATAAAMTRAGRPYDFAIYEDAGHGFLDSQDGQDGANRLAAEAAWPRTLDFLRTNLEHR